MTTLEKKDADGVTVVRFTGSLNQLGVDAVERDFGAAAGAARRLVVDLSQVDVLNTPAIAMFLSAQRQLKQSGGRLILTGTRGLVDELLRRCRLDVVLTIVPSIEEAVEWARQ